MSDFLDGLTKNVDMPDPYFWEVALFEMLYYKIASTCQVILETYNSRDILELFEETAVGNGLVLEQRA